MTKISNEKRIVLKIPIQESSLLHDITKAAARLCVLVCNPFARERWYILGFRPRSSGASVTRQLGIRATARPYWQNVHWLEALLFNWFNHWFNWLDHCFNHWLNWLKRLNWLNWLEPLNWLDTLETLNWLDTVERLDWLDTLETFNWLEHQRNGMSTG